MLCFANTYEVESWRDGKGARFVVSTASQETPFKIDSETAFMRRGHGTKLSVQVARHLADPDRIRDLLSARFLHDPQFVVRVNGRSIGLPEHVGLIEQIRLDAGSGRVVEAFVVDSTRAAKSTLYQGVAFWVNGRLVGTPSWIVGNTAVIDGRALFAKPYSIVISGGDEWIQEIEPDWSRFKTVPAVGDLNEAVCRYAPTVFAALR